MLTNNSVKLGLYACRVENKQGFAETSSNLTVTKDERETNIQEELLVEEQSDELVGPLPPLEYTKKVYLLFCAPL